MHGFACVYSTYLNVYVCPCLCMFLRCVCPEGFEGDTCEINIDDCEDNDCENNSTCIDGINNYTCMCSPEYTGKTHFMALIPPTSVGFNSLSVTVHTQADTDTEYKTYFSCRSFFQCSFYRHSYECKLLNKDNWSCTVSFHSIKVQTDHIFLTNPGLLLLVCLLLHCANHL